MNSYDVFLHDLIIWPLFWPIIIWYDVSLIIVSVEYNGIRQTSYELILFFAQLP